MPALRILIADDQIPPSDIPEKEFQKRFFAEYGDNQQNRRFMHQCVFMRDIVQALRDSGYSVTAARTYADAGKEITNGEFDLAIIDLNWSTDSSLPEKDKRSAGWGLCEKLDDKDEQHGRRTPQILFSSRFPDEPELSQKAALRQKLPIFKEATANVRNSLMAAVGFVDATLAGQRSAQLTSSSQFDHELQNIALSLFKEPLRNYRQWASLTLVLVAVSVASVLICGVLAFLGTQGVQKPAALSSIASIVSSLISTLLYKRLAAEQKAMESVRREVLKQLGTRGAKIVRT